MSILWKQRTPTEAFLHGVGQNMIEGNLDLRAYKIYAQLDDYERMTIDLLNIGLDFEATLGKLKSQIEESER